MVTQVMRQILLTTSFFVKNDSLSRFDTYHPQHIPTEGVVPLLRTRRLCHAYNEECPQEGIGQVMGYILL